MYALCLNETRGPLENAHCFALLPLDLLVVVHESRWLAWSMNADGCRPVG